MLWISSTKNAAGAIVYGDPSDLLFLSATVKELVKVPQLDISMKNYVSRLATEADRAQRGHRITQPHDLAPSGEFPAFQVFWPELLIQAGQLRHAAGHMSTDRGTQATLSRLEACIFEALDVVDPVIAKECMSRLDSFCGLDAPYHVAFLYDCTWEYVHGGPQDRTRFDLLLDFLSGLAPWMPKYKKYDEALRALAKENQMEPEEFTSLYGHDWPDIEW